MFSCEGVGRYPDTESNSKEPLGAHLRPGPVSKLLSVGDGEQRLVLPVAEGHAGPLQELLLLLAEPGGEHGQHGHGGEQTCHFESVFHSEMPTNK